MKKMILFLLIVSTLFSTLSFKVDKNPLLAYEIAKMCIVGDFETEAEDVEIVPSGDLYFNFFKSEFENFYKKYSDNAEAVQFYFLNADLGQMFYDLKFEIIEESKVGDMQVYCGYSPFFQKSYFLDGKKCNLQFACYKNGEVVIGFPIILTGF